MIVLIVEDNEAKSQQLSRFLSEQLPTATIVERRSYNSGLAAIRDLAPSVVLLDMSMPTFDRVTAHAGGRVRPYAGKDILAEVRRLALHVQAIVVTRFETFGDGPQRRTLEELQSELSAEFPDTYVGTVYYHASRSDWRVQLRRLLSHLDR